MVSAGPVEPDTASRGTVSLALPVFFRARAAFIASMFSPPILSGDSGTGAAGGGGAGAGAGDPPPEHIVSYVLLSLLCGS